MLESDRKEMNKYLLFNQAHDIGEICAPLRYLGINGFFYMKLYKDGTFVNLATNLYLAEDYLNKLYSCKYFLSDITDSYLFDNVSLWELNKHNKIWAGCKEVFGIGNGLSLSLPSAAGFMELFFYYTNADNYKINEFYLSHLDDFKNFSLYFREKAKDVIKKGETTKITIPTYYQEIHYGKEDKEHMTSNIQSYYSSLDIKKFYFDEEKYLTYKEAECLSWYTRGMTVKETAKKLHISNKTVESHLDNIKIKLGINNKSCLTQFSLTFGLFDFFKNINNYAK